MQRVWAMLEVGIAERDHHPGDAGSRRTGVHVTVSAPPCEDRLIAG
jgi:hypothetical protein